MQRSSMTRIVVGYAVVASLYILFSDELLYRLAPDIAQGKWISIGKGLGFVLVTACSLWLLMWRLQTEESQRYQALVANHQAIMLLIDPRSGAIVDCNESAAAFYRYPIAQLRRLNIGDINRLSPDDIQRRMRRVIDRGHDLLHLSHWLGDGSERIVSIQTGPVEHHGQRLLLSIIRDETDDVRNQWTLNRLLSLHAMLSHSNQLLVKATSHNELYGQLCRIAVDIGGFLFAWISLRDPGGNMQPVGRAGVLPVLGDGKASPPVESWRQAIDRGDFGSSIAIALRSGKEVIGSFELYSSEADFFGPRELETLDAMIDDLAFGLENLRRVATLEIATQVVEASPVVLYRLDDIAKWHITFVTENVRHWGYSSTSILSGITRFDHIVHHEDLARVQRELAAALQERKGQFTQIYRVLTADGQLRWIEDKTAAKYAAGGSLLFLEGAMTDITESYRMQLALQESELRYRAMVTNSPDMLLINTDGHISFMNPSGARMLGAASVEQVIGLPVMSIIDPAYHAQVSQRIGRARQMPNVTMPVVDILFRKLDGSPLRVEVTASSFYNNGNLDILAFCHDLTFREQAKLTIEEYVQKLERAVTATTGAMSQMVELRDPYTAGHEHRVGQMAAAIAAEMGLDENIQRGLRIAGALHDVGKIMVPAEILTKPGRLTPVEYQLVKQHAEQGYKVLSQVDFPWPVAEVAHQHHERLDGSGYPCGLKGDEILLEARIIAVADVVESMCSHRPYRPSRGVDEALAEIEKGSGTVYDATAVAASLRLFREKNYKVPA